MDSSSTYNGNNTADYQISHQQRYDRQIRLWGEEGQNSIKQMGVCVFGSSTLATELLKSLVLAGIARFHIIDDADVAWRDLGQNFFLDENCVGRSRAECVTNFLKELNPSVDGNYSHTSLNNFSSEHFDNLLNFSIVIGINLSANHTNLLSSFLFETNLPFISVRVYGLLGLLQLSFKEHVIFNDHNEENEPYDLRLDCPFEELVALANGTDFNSMESAEDFRTHSHTPYLLIYLKLVDKWRSNQVEKSIMTNEQATTAFPVITQVRREFERIIDEMRMPHPEGKSIIETNFDEAKMNLFKGIRKTETPKHVREVFLNTKTQHPLDGIFQKFDTTLLSPFWLLSTALRIFAETNNGRLPVTGQLPDMTSDTERYSKLVEIYRAKAFQDSKELFKIMNEVREYRLGRYNENDYPDAELDDKFSDSSSNTSSSYSSGHGSGTAATGSPSCYVERCSDGGDELSRMSVCSAEAIDGVQPDICDLELCVKGQRLKGLKKKLPTISFDQCQQFCKNSRRIGVLYGSPIDTEKNKAVDQLVELLREGVFCEFDGKLDPRIWPIVLKAVDMMHDKTGRWPTTDSADLKALEQNIYSLINNKLGFDKNSFDIISTFIKAAVEEACRYSGAEPHVTAAIIGGCAAQEAIKLCTHQYVPIQGNLLFDGHLHTAFVYCSNN